MVVDLRYHVASMVAVFLALGLGILVGMSLSGDGRLVAEQNALIDSIEAQLGTLRERVSALQAENVNVRASLGVYQTLFEMIEPSLLAGKTTGRRFGLAIVGDRVAPGNLVQDLRAVIEASGGQLVATAAIGPPSPDVVSKALSPHEEAAWIQAVATALVDGNPKALDLIEAGRGGLFLWERLSNEPVDYVICVINAGAQDAVFKSRARQLCESAGKAGGHLILATPTGGATDLALTMGADRLVIDHIDTDAGRLALIWGVARGLTGVFGQSQKAQALLPLPMGEVAPASSG